MNKFIIQSENTSVEFIDLPTAEQYALKNNIATDQIEQIEYITGSLTPEDIYNQKIEKGYNLPGTPYYLGMEISDRIQFNGMLSLINEALDAGYITADSSQSMNDKDGNRIDLTAGEFKQMMVGYGFYYKTLWDNY